MALVDGFLELERSSGKLEWSAILQKMASDLGFSKILFGLLPKDAPINLSCSRGKLQFSRHLQRHWTK
ncbi:hypothetical protein OFL40_24955, partial [Pseudomonas aeruginosa]|nr:hypothetical protein [Pseudomonas aeruginosa]